MAIIERQSSTAPPEPDYGRRLLVDVVDETAASDPSRPIVFEPRTTEAEDGWAPITYKQFANAVNHVARIVADKVKSDCNEPFPTLAYIGPNDIRYGVVMLACIKAGCQAMFLSPRNSVKGQLNLLERMRCRHFWYTKSFESLVQLLVREREMQVSMVPAADEWLESQPSPFPYSRLFEEARWEPLVVLHTSGSTGIPKPIVVFQGSIAISDGFRNLPEYQGTVIVFKQWAALAKRIFTPMPLFHAGGLIAAFITLGIYYGMPVALGITERPLTAELILKSMDHADVDATFLPPSIVEELSQDEKSIAALRKLKFVVVGGGNLSSVVGAKLVEKGVFLSNAIASTEMAPYALYLQPKAELWQYFIFNSQLMGADWRRIDENEDTYELVIRRKDPRDPMDQPVFYTFQELTEWSTKDLYKPHPSLPDHWAYHGRTDSVIVFSTGEKLNPTTIEGIVTGHPAIKGALVVGKDRFQPALILEPFAAPKSDADAEALIDDVWPLIEQANTVSVAHGRLVRHLVAISDPTIPFSRAPKGTIQRALVLQDYERFIDAMYERAEDIEAGGSVPLDLSDEAALTQSIMQLFTTQIHVKGMQPDTDFFSLGVDSLLVMSISRILRGSFKSAGVPLDHNAVAPRAIYSHPTAERLAEYLLWTAKGGGEPKESEDARELKALESLISKYTKDLPAPNVDKQPPRDDEQTVVLTGTTGSLGAYLLDRLCTSSHVKRIIALNRSDDGGKARQGSISAARGLRTDFSKVEFHYADLSRPDLGLGAAKHAELLSTVDRIIHNAWPVNFHISIASFEPHIRGVRHFADFSIAAAKRVPIIFISSISTVSCWNSQEPVPERRLDDLALATMGYGRSKLAGSMILDAAASRSGVPAASIRVGQIGGPRGRKGMWNKQEFMPTLIASSIYLGVLPKHLGNSEEIDWLPIEDVAGLILDVSGVTVNTSVSDINGYFHGVNPVKTTWGELAKVLAQYYNGRIKSLVSLEEWVAALEKSASTNAELKKNPGIKLLDTYKGMMQGPHAEKGQVTFGMTRTMSRSPTVANPGPITPDLLKNWCSQWDF